MFDVCCLWCSRVKDNDNSIQEDEEEARVQLAMSDDCKNTKKITGYLERRGKLLMNSWKRYWYVLEGHLLLYYGSKEEYDALSPCKGSLTLGPTCSVKPYSSTTHKFQITTRSGNVVTLRAESILEQNKWMQAICTTLNENQKVDISPTKLCHFRYSTESVDLLVNTAEQPKLNTTPTDVDTPPSDATLEKEDTHLLERLQRLGARSYAEDIVTNHQMIVNKRPKLKKLELNEKVPKKKEGPLHSPKVLQYSPNVPKISEEPTESTGEEIVLEDEDYCVCLLDKTEDSNPPKKIPLNQPRSISFSIAREVFNRNSNSSAHISKAKFKRNSESSVQEKDKKPIKELENLTEKIQQFRENLDNIILAKSNNKDELSTDFEAKVPEDVPYQRAEEEKPLIGPRSSNLVTEEHNMTEDPHSGQNSDNKMQEEKQPSRISLIGSYYSSDNDNTDTENPQSYQDFRENELYAIPNENRVDTSSRQTKSRQQSLELHFPPPPVEAYESIPDLIDVVKNHQEVREDDFIWQNEIYEPLDRQDLQYAEAIFPDTSKAYSKVGKVDKVLGKKKVDTYDNLYEEVDDEFTFVRSPTRKEFEQRNTYVEIDDTRTKLEKQDQVGVEIDNDIYGQTTKDIHRDPQTPKVEKTNIKFFKTKHAEDETEVDNDLYAVPSEIFHKNNSIDTNNKDLQMENDLYSTVETNEEEVQYDNELYAECERRPLFSRTNSRSDKLEPPKQENLSKNKNHHDEMVQVDNDLYEAVSVKNDIYAEPIINARTSDTELLYDEPKLEGGSIQGNTQGNVEMPLYEDPDELITRPQKSEDKLTKKKKLRKAKSEEIKKHDNFLQRMLKQATRKSSEKSDKNAEEETLAQLAGIKDLLEKKKKEIMEGMVGLRPRHRRIQSDTDAQLRYVDKNATPSSVDLNEEYSTVRDNIKDDNEVIYSEVARSSKELKDLIQDLLERTKKDNQGV
ncbi:uncharacterized protein LOC123683302 isoform X2 [Harmonia axyridis]|uniref:uncharacterized protein LOC123683302 isoform X2 n=2 Tax=Harmonia axyridis TaxID=115357 RepID=UPI001E277827|nr:uncharacterized protein LOC123683302 isoform X2 [Harmonia axyridis]